MNATDVPRILAASHLFGEPARDQATERFLTTPGHHLLAAYEGEDPIGFVTGVEMTQPDKGTDLFLYELAVDEPFQGHGVGRRLVDALSRLARSIVR